jgi:hypothetical protein
VAFEIPQSALPRCIECKEMVDPDHPLVLREVTGFFRKRMKGGQNHVIFRTETGRFLCGGCARAKKRTGIPGQGELL